MKTRCLSIAIVFSALTYSSGADPIRIVIDPIADYTSRHQDDLRAESDRDEHIVKIEIDVDNDGKKDLFLSREKSCVLDKMYENKVYVWDLYRKLEDGRYAVIDQEQSKLENGEVYRHASEFSFDPAKIYVGFIKEIGAFGILATYYLPKHNGVEFGAYVLRGDYFEELNFPDPTKPVGIYHRDDSGNIPDLPETARPYVASPPKETMVIIP